MKLLSTSPLLYLLLASVQVTAVAFVVSVGPLSQSTPRKSQHITRSGRAASVLSIARSETKHSSRLMGMKRPLLDQLASTLFRIETERVQASSEVDDKGRNGEPVAWAESDSLANRFSQAVSENTIGYKFKQFVVDIVAGNEYDADEVKEFINTFAKQNDVAMLSFSTCPFCRRAKDALDERGIDYATIELDELPGNRGNEIRAELGRLVQRTSVPAIFVKGKFIGGCNDGSPGLLLLLASGRMDNLLRQ
jgi:glutaredoxin 3